MRKDCKEAVPGGVFRRCFFYAVRMVNVGGFGKAAAFGNDNKCFKLRVVQNKSLLLNALAAHVVAAECALFVKFNFMVQAAQRFLHMLQTVFQLVAFCNQKFFAFF